MTLYAFAWRFLPAAVKNLFYTGVKILLISVLILSNNSSPFSIIPTRYSHKFTDVIRQWPAHSRVCRIVRLPSPHFSLLRAPFPSSLLLSKTTSVSLRGAVFLLPSAHTMSVCSRTRHFATLIDERRTHASGSMLFQNRSYNTCKYCLNECRLHKTRSVLRKPPSLRIISASERSTVKRLVLFHTVRAVSILKIKRVLQHRTGRSNLLRIKDGMEK